MFWDFFKKKNHLLISPQEVKARLDHEDAFLLIDVRTPDEYARGHIGRSISLPLAVLEERVSEVATAKDTDIVVYCQSGARAARAVEALSEMGYTNVKNMGGISSWPYEIFR